MLRKASSTRPVVKTVKNLLSCLTGAFSLMDYIEKVLEKLKEWARKLVGTLLGPEPQPEPELIPIPVNNPRRRSR